MKRQMFPIAIFSPLYTQKYLTQVIKNKNLLFLKTTNRNVLNAQIKNRWMIWPYEINRICNFVRLCFNKNKNTTLKSTKTLKSKKNIKNWKKNIKKEKEKTRFL